LLIFLKKKILYLSLFMLQKIERHDIIIAVEVSKMFKIAIDGPAGAGKSTIAKRIAEKLGIEYIDTGAMYRAITLKAMRLNVALDEESSYAFLKTTTLDIANGRVLLDGEDVSEAIRGVEITNQVSIPSKMAVVRSYLVDYQRAISNEKSVVMDGRDIGTTVLPNAELKIYLDATIECRALRRKKEREENGFPSQSIEEIQTEIRERDYKDSHREISPLTVANDAVVVDTSQLSIDEVVEVILNLVNERGLIKMSEKLEVGQEVNGRVMNATSKAIYLELENEEKAVIYPQDILGYKEDQKLNELYSEGAEFKAQIKKISKDIKSGSPLYILSTRLEEEKARLQVFADLMDKDEVFSAKIIRVTHGGADVSYKGVKAFLPLKNTNMSYEDLTKAKGTSITVCVTFIDMDRLFVLVSHTIADRKEKRAAKEAAYAALEVGQVVKGTVVSILPCGAIVSLGELSGLLHISEIDYKMVKDVNKYFTVGQEVEVKIIKLEDGKIGFSKKALSKHPWELLKEQYHVDDVFEGTVTKIIPAGALIQLTPDYAGLMPKSEYSWLINEHFDDHVKEQDKITVKVISIEDKGHRVSLSHRATVENLWSDVKLRRNEVISVTIESIEEKGATVSYGKIKGFMPVGEVAGEKRVSRVDEAYPVGTVVDAMVLEFDALRAKLVVSPKAVETAKERKTFDEYFKEQEKETPTSTFGDLVSSYLNNEDKKDEQ
jgi:cytidylate kinase